MTTESPDYALGENDAAPGTTGEGRHQQRKPTTLPLGHVRRMRASKQGHIPSEMLRPVRPGHDHIGGLLAGLVVLTVAGTLVLLEVLRP